jgi:hypothetical protein
MANNKTLYIILIILVLVIVGGGILFFSNNNETQKEVETNQQATTSSDETMVDCSIASDPSCFLNRMNGCLPVTAKMTSSDSKTIIEITILGVQDNKCHFQRKINNALSLDCYFPKGTLNMDTLDQTFGNDKGLQKVVDDACKSAGW